MILFNKKDILKKLKAKAHDRKGLGMELAIMVLLVVFGCSLLMVSSAMWAGNHLSTKEEQTMQRLEIDEYAELVLAKVLLNKTFDATRFSGYSYSGDGVNEPLAINHNEKTVLEITLEITLEDSKIKSWTYNTGE